MPRKKKLTQEELESLSLRRSANASPREAVLEREAARMNINAPANRLVVQPEGKQTQHIPQKGAAGEGIKRAMKLGQASRRARLHNMEAEERERGQERRRRGHGRKTRGTLFGATIY